MGATNHATSWGRDPTRSRMEWGRHKEFGDEVGAEGWPAEARSQPHQGRPPQGRAEGLMWRICGEEGPDCGLLTLGLGQC